MFPSAGGPKLKSSQAYPPLFGRAIAAVYNRHGVSIRHDAEHMIASQPRPGHLIAELLRQGGGDLWEDAGLSPVQDMLMHLLSSR
jgi:hypothetical protein